MKRQPLENQDLMSSNEALLKAQCFTAENILECLPVAYYVCNATGVITEYNGMAVEIWGREPSAGQSEASFFAGYRRYFENDGLVIPRENPVALSLKDGRQRKDLETEIDRPGASRLVISENISAVKDNSGKVVGVINSFYDITRKKQAEDEGKKKSLELADFVENAAVGLHWVDENGIIIWANRAELDMLGYTAGEYIGHHISEFHAHGDKIKDILKKLSGNETLSAYETELVCKDGSHKTVFISSNVLWEDDRFIHTRCFTIDASVQKKLFSELEEKESYYSQVLLGLQMPVYTTDTKGNLTFYNDAAATLWGCKPALGEPIGCSNYKLFRPDGSKLPYTEWPVPATLKEKHGLAGQELLIERPNGVKRNILSYPEPIFDESGKHIGVVNLLVDVTTSKETERSLRENQDKLFELTTTLETQVEKRTAELLAKNEELKFSEERYHKMIDEVEDYAIILLDKDGTILNWNKGAEKIKGYTPEEIYGKNFRIFYTPEDLAAGRPDRLIRLAANSGKAADEGWRVRKDGTRFWGSIVITALHDEHGNVTGFSKVTRDLTERKMAEEELKKSEERYHRMVDEVEDYAIILLDTNGTVKNWNKGAEKIKGFKPEEIIGKNFSVFYTKEDRERGRPLELITLAYKTGKAADEGWRVRNDGTRFWGSIVITALHNKQGEVIGFSKVTRDLTERKLAEDKMREYSTALEFQNKELEQFAYAASHDMKEPLRKIHLYNSFINENPNNQLDSKSKEYLNRSIQAVRRMNLLIEDLLTYSKSTSRIETFENTDINELLNEIALIHKEELEQKKVKIEMDVFPEMKVVPFQFKQLMDNLVSNSIKYSHPERNVEVKIKYALVHGAEIMEREAEQELDYHKISVVDNGIGFESQYENKVFEIFQRLSNPAGIKGSGIGLAICKKIAQNHKGFIKAKGRINEGATFEVYIPVNPGSALPAK
jgi:PAS domain S-box-containing protein